MIQRNNRWELNIEDEVIKALLYLHVICWDKL